MSPSTNDMDRATKALIGYGYTQMPDGTLERGRKDERYVPVEGGFLRWYRGKPMCFKIADAWRKVSGLTMETHPECFDMVYPAEWVIAEYEAGTANNAKRAAEAAARKAG